MNPDMENEIARDKSEEKQCLCCYHQLTVAKVFQSFGTFATKKVVLVDIQYNCEKLAER